MNIGIRSEISIEEKIAHKIGFAVTTSIALASKAEIELAIKQAIDEGVLIVESESKQCPNCGQWFTGSYCEICNQDPEDPDLLDQGFTETDSEQQADLDDADYEVPESFEEKELFSPTPDCLSPYQQAFAVLSEIFGFDDNQAAIGSFLLFFYRECNQDLVVQDYSDQQVIATIINKVSEVMNIDQDLVTIVWQSVADNLTNIFAELDEEPDPQDLILGDGADIEIRREGNDFIIIEDSVEKLGVGKRGYINLPGNPYLIDANLFLEKKQMVADNLYAIAEAIIHFRKPFLTAKTKEDAQRIIATEPLEQHQIAEFCEVHKSTISRYTKKVIITPHGRYLLKDLLSRQAQASFDKEAANNGLVIEPRRRGRERIQESKVSRDTVKNWIRDIVRDGEKLRNVYSYEDIRKLLHENYGIYYSEKGNMVGKICRELGIVNSWARKKLKKDDN